MFLYMLLLFFVLWLSCCRWPGSRLAGVLYHHRRDCLWMYRCTDSHRGKLPWGQQIVMDWFSLSHAHSPAYFLTYLNLFYKYNITIFSVQGLYLLLLAYMCSSFTANAHSQNDKNMYLSQPVIITQLSQSQIAILSNCTFLVIYLTIDSVLLPEPLCPRQSVSPINLID